MMQPISNVSVPLILLGGTLCDEQLWQPMLAQLNVSSVHCFTLQGDDSAKAAAERLLAVLPARFCLCGFSLGAMVALEIQSIAPARVAGLALISVNPFADRPENAPIRRAAVAQARVQGMGTFIAEQLWPRYVARQRQSDTALQQRIVAMAQRSGVEVFAAQTEIAISRVDHRESLGSLKVPVLILSGEEDPICTTEHHRAVQQAAPLAHWKVLPSVGHFVPLEAAQDTATALHSWINEVFLCDSTR
ncbi:alpha/beta hydrolase [Scandinavium sp.]|uniref:alpha/beta fold hydrolase n=1 Tax=Scandinavium sp. TaxID=2830653 RepID=UPI00289F7FB7|nr:alpha/beta hydrolase [Scandinavium sp.]